MSDAIIMVESSPSQRHHVLDNNSNDGHKPNNTLNKNDPANCILSSNESGTSNNNNDNRLAPFQPTHASAQEAALALLHLTHRDVFFDLGCGDGRLVLKAFEEFYCRDTAAADAEDDDENDNYNNSGANEDKEDCLGLVKHVECEGRINNGRDGKRQVCATSPPRSSLALTNKNKNKNTFTNITTDTASQTSHDNQSVPSTATTAIPHLMRHSSYDSHGSNDSTAAAAEYQYTTTTTTTTTTNPSNTYVQQQQQRNQITPIICNRKIFRHSSSQSPSSVSANTSSPPSRTTTMHYREEWLKQKQVLRENEEDDEKEREIEEQHDDSVITGTNNTSQISIDYGGDDENDDDNDNEHDNDDDASRGRSLDIPATIVAKTKPHPSLLPQQRELLLQQPHHQQQSHERSHQSLLLLQQQQQQRYKSSNTTTTTTAAAAAAAAALQQIQTQTSSSLKCIGIEYNQAYANVGLQKMEQLLASCATTMKDGDSNGKMQQLQQLQQHVCIRWGDVLEEWSRGGEELTILSSSENDALLVPNDGGDGDGDDSNCDNNNNNNNIEHNQDKSASQLTLLNDATAVFVYLLPDGLKKIKPLLLEAAKRHRRRRQEVIKQGLRMQQQQQQQQQCPMEKMTHRKGTYSHISDITDYDNNSFRNINDNDAGYNDDDDDDDDDDCNDDDDNDGNIREYQVIDRNGFHTNTDIITTEPLSPSSFQHNIPQFRIVSYMFSIPGWKPAKVDRSSKGGCPLYLYEDVDTLDC